MDRISIKRLEVQAHVGVTEEERATEQLLILDVDIATDLRRAGATDDLVDTIDYGRVTEEVADLVRSTTAALLEHLAEKVAAHIAAFPGVNGVSVEIAKASPPIAEEVGAVAVKIERAER